MREQVTDRHGQVMVGVHQPRRGRDNAVPVRIGVVGEGHLVLVLEADEPGHRVRAGAVHADLAVVIDGHERKRRVDLRVHDVNVQAVNLVDRPPVVDRCAAQGIHSQRESGAANRLQIDDVPQIDDVGNDEVFLVGRAGLDRPVERDAFHRAIAAAEQFVGPVLDPFGHVGVRRAAVGRIVLEAAVLGGIVRRRDDDAVRQVLLPAAVVDENGARDDGGGGHAVVALDDRMDFVARQDLQRRALGRRGKGVRVLAHVQRAVRAFDAPVIADGLGNGEYVGLGKAAVQRRTAVSTGAEADQLVGVAHVRPTLVILSLESGQIDQECFGSGLARER